MHSYQKSLAVSMAIIGLLLPIIVDVVVRTSLAAGGWVIPWTERVPLRLTIYLTSWVPLLFLAGYARTVLSRCSERTNADQRWLFVIVGTYLGAACGICLASAVAFEVAEHRVIWMIPPWNPPLLILPLAVIGGAAGWLLGGLTWRMVHLFVR